MIRLLGMDNSSCSFETRPTCQRNLACSQQQWKICDVWRSHVCTSFHVNMTDLMLRLACSPLNKGNYNKSLVPTSSNCATLVSNTNVVNSSCTCNATNWGILDTRIVESNYNIVSNFSFRFTDNLSISGNIFSTKRFAILLNSLIKF